MLKVIKIMFFLNSIALDFVATTTASTLHKLDVQHAVDELELK